MILQISSGQGPAECEIAVGKLFDALADEYMDLVKISEHRSKYSPEGGYTSIMFSTDQDLSKLEGSVLWICKSPVREGWKRKNWYVDVSIIPEAEEICTEKEVKVETFHSSGKGGQNVNKVETGVRVTHIPTGITITSTAERSQFLNKQDALKKLSAVLKEMEKKEKAKQKNSAWREHTQIVRGNPVRVYEGIGFKRKDVD